MVSGCLVCKSFNFCRFPSIPFLRCPICYVLVVGHLVFMSFLRWFRGHASKTVILGGSSIHGSGTRTIMVSEDKLDPSGPPVQPMAHGMEKVFGTLSYGLPNPKEVEEEERGEMVKPKAPRKTVSINHNVEVIEDYLSNKKRKRKAMEKWPSMEIEGDGPKPLKSILKVGSKQI